MVGIRQAGERLLVVGSAQFSSELSNLFDWASSQLSIDLFTTVSDIEAYFVRPPIRSNSNGICIHNVGTGQCSGECSLQFSACYC